MFRRIREFQKEYGYQRNDGQIGNWFTPCTIRDHYEIAYKLIKETNAIPIDKSAEEAINDISYYNGLIAYGKKFKEMTDEKWREMFLGEKKETSLLQNFVKFTKSIVDSIF